MTSWRKRLAEMAADPKPNTYRYAEAAGLLTQLGFTVASKPTGSHRIWRLVVPTTADGRSKRTIVVSLVDNGNGPMRSVYVKELVKTLRANNLLPAE